MAKRQDAATYYLETAPGLEEVAWLELRRRFPRADHVAFLYAKDQHGIVVFRYAGDPAKLFLARMAEALYLLVAYLPDLSRGYRDLRALPDRLLRTGDLGGAVNRFSRIQRRRPQTYQLIVRKFGQYEYGRKELRQAMARILNDYDPGWQRVQKDAGVELYAGAYGSTMLIGLRLPAPAGRQTNAQQAAAVLLAEPTAAARFVDPYCGDGSILIERQLAGPARLLLGGSDNPEAIAAARASVGGQASLGYWAPGALPLAAQSVDTIASLWPEVPRVHYVAWLEEVARVLRAGGRAVILTPAYDLFREAVRSVPALQIERGYSARIGGSWGRIYIVSPVSEL
jgi:SAM-dependent methyltransferase